MFHEEKAASKCFLEIIEIIEKIIHTSKCPLTAPRKKKIENERKWLKTWKAQSGPRPMKMFTTKSVKAYEEEYSHYTASHYLVSIINLINEENTMKYLWLGMSKWRKKLPSEIRNRRKCWNNRLKENRNRYRNPRPTITSKATSPAYFPLPKICHQSACLPAHQKSIFWYERRNRRNHLCNDFGYVKKKKKYHQMKK